VTRYLCIWSAGWKQSQLSSTVDVLRVKPRLAARKKHYTRSFERYVLDLSRHMTTKDVAEHIQVSGDTVKDIQARVVVQEDVDCDKGKLSTSFISSRRGSWFHVEHSYSSDRIVKRLFAESTTLRIVGIVMCHHQLQPAFAGVLSTILDDEPLERPALINSTL
jgi:hypothetical protein